MSDVPDDVIALVKVPVLLSVATVGRVLDCHPRTVRRRIHDGSLPAVIDHGRQMVRGDDLRDYVDALQRVNGSTGASPRNPRRRSTTGRYDFVRE